MKLLKGTAVVLPTILYILFFQIIFAPKYRNFTDYYIADTITIVKEETDKLEIIKEYQDDDGYYTLEITKSDPFTILLNGEIDINGNAFQSALVAVEVEGNNYVLVSRERSIIGNFEEQKDYTITPTNNEKITSTVVISIGTILGLLAVLLIARAKFPVEMKMTISLAVLTLFLFMLQTIIKDMFWVVVSFDVGWVAYLGLDKIPTKAARLQHKITKKQAEQLGIK